MPRLLLVRHAEAEIVGPEGDISRPLTARGWAGAAQAGLYLRACGLTPDLAVSSPARRARETLEAILRALPEEPSSCEFNDALYSADAETLMEVITHTSAAVMTLLMIGHNPGVSQFARLLVKADTALPGHFPSPCIAAIELLCGEWSRASAGCGALDRFKGFGGKAGYT
jgi:phosphohistidine phosphatase